MSERSPGHETRDVNIKAVLIFVGALVVILVLLAVGLGFLFRHYQGREDRDKPSSYPLAAEERAEPRAERVKEVPSPRLDGMDLGKDAVSAAAQARAEEAWLDGRGPVPGKSGVVHVPIREAMTLLVEERKTPEKPR